MNDAKENVHVQVIYHIVYGAKIIRKNNNKKTNSSNRGRTKNKIQEAKVQN